MATRKYYTVWGSDKAYRWLWLACLVTGWHHAQARWLKQKQYESK